MSASSQIAGPAETIRCRREIDRFIRAAHQRSECEVDSDGRVRRRYHRSWPMLVSRVDGDDTETSVALHNAAVLGVSFLSSQCFAAGATVFIKLFWYDSCCARIPAVVRHVTRTEHGYLIGCEFLLNDRSVREE